MGIVTVGSPLVLNRDRWQEAERAHIARADQLTAARRTRAATGEGDPIEDFLFDYYGVKPRHLRIWHPGVGVRLENARQWQNRRWYQVNNGLAELDASTFLTQRSGAVSFISALLQRLESRPPVFRCFGMHEWAMVYRQQEHRHQLPLRLGSAATDAVVDSHDLRCTHFDAFRFFTPDARELNQPLTRDETLAQERPGCLHSGMDLFKWSLKLAPAIGGQLLLDSFELARDIRVVDMQASPYDVTSLGHEPIAIETPSGKAEYVRAQRAFEERAGRIRRSLISQLALLPPTHPHSAST